MEVNYQVPVCTPVWSPPLIVSFIQVVFSTPNHHLLFLLHSIPGWQSSHMTLPRDSRFCLFLFTWIFDKEICPSAAYFCLIKTKPSPTKVLMLGEHFEGTFLFVIVCVSFSGKRPWPRSSVRGFTWTVNIQPRSCGSSCFSGCPILLLKGEPRFEILISPITNVDLCYFWSIAVLFGEILTDLWLKQPNFSATTGSEFLRLMLCRVKPLLQFHHLNKQLLNNFIVWQMTDLWLTQPHFSTTTGQNFSHNILKTVIWYPNIFFVIFHFKQPNNESEWMRFFCCWIIVLL